MGAVKTFSTCMLLSEGKYPALKYSAKSAFSRLISNVKQFDKHFKFKVYLSAFYEEEIVERKLEKLLLEGNIFVVDGIESSGP